jgi:serine/threonine protein kinase
MFRARQVVSSFERPSRIAHISYGGADRIVNVDYTIPEKPVVSEACKDLLRKLIVLDPEHRLTIPQIAQHPWFREGLPADIFSVNDRLSL